MTFLFSLTTRRLAQPRAGRHSGERQQHPEHRGQRGPGPGGLRGGEPAGGDEDQDKPDLTC